MSTTSTSTVAAPAGGTPAVAAEPSATSPGRGGPAAHEQPGIEFDAVSVDLGGHRVLDGFSLRARRGEVVALLGPSGAGKSTALRALAGLVPVTEGRVFLGGVDVTRTPVRRRGIGMVVQSYALFPHMSVARNVAFGLRRRGARADATRARVQEVLEMVGMGAHAERLPRQLSGGQQQRVAIARALAPSPDVLLLDEPLSALDAQLRQGMLAELARVHRELPDLTMLYVTHGQNEALTLADTVAVMADARLVEAGPTRDLYRSPRREFTAAFLGSANLVPLRVTTTEHGTAPDGTDVVADLAGRVPGERVVLAVRPHRLRLLDDDAAVNVADLLVTDVQWRGSTHVVTGTAWGVELSLEALELRRPPAVGTTVRVGFDGQDVVVLDPAGAGTEEPS